MNTDVRTVRMMSLVLCVVLSLIARQEVGAAVGQGPKLNSYDLNGDPRLAGPQPPFKPQSQAYPGLESEMDPQPDYGYTSYNGSGKLQGKVAIITGGDSGIGRAVALAFAREGASIVISYLNETTDAEEIQKIIQKEGHECILIPGDITEEAQCKKIIDETVAKFKRIDILVNNAAYQGRSQPDSVEGMSHERVLHTFKTNIIAMFDLVRLAVPHMPRGSSIINVGSVQAYQPSPAILDYASTKGAIVTFTKGLSGQLIKKGIRINCVAPGPIWTPLVLPREPSKESVKHGAGVAMKRPGQPRELAPAFVYLAAGSESSYVTGTVLTVAGGIITA